MTLGYQGSDWESELVVDTKTRQVLFASMYPNGVGGGSGGGNKAVLVEGDHAFQALGDNADRLPTTAVGVTQSVVTAGVRASVVLSGAYKANIANVLTYAANIPDTYSNSVNEWTPVYIDDSDSLANDTTTLSLSPLNEDGDDNPLAGWIRRDQSDFDDTFAGGAASVATWPLTPGATESVFAASVELKGAG